MDLKIEGLRVLVTAGASGIGLATARAFAAKARVCFICDVDRERAGGGRGERPGARARSSATSRSPPSVDRLFDCGHLGARRPRCARQQCRHRRAHGAVRGRRARRLGAHARRQPDGPIPLRAARDSAAQGERATRASPTSPRRRAASAFRCARRTRRRSGASSGSRSRCRSSSAPFGIRVNAICPGSVAGPRIDQRLREQGGGARRRRRTSCATKRSRKTSLRRLVTAEDIANAIVFLASPARQQHLRACAAGRRAIAGARLTQGVLMAKHPFDLAGKIALVTGALPRPRLRDRARARAKPARPSCSTAASRSRSRRRPRR